MNQNKPVYNGVRLCIMLLLTNYTAYKNESQLHKCIYNEESYTCEHDFRAASSICVCAARHPHPMKSTGFAFFETYIMMVLVSIADYGTIPSSEDLSIINPRNLEILNSKFHILVTNAPVEACAQYMLV